VRAVSEEGKRLPLTAQAIETHSSSLQAASRELTVALRLLADPHTGAVPRVNETISRMTADLRNATDHVRSMMSGLNKELWRSIVVLCASAMGLGIVIGTLFDGGAVDTGDRGARYDSRTFSAASR
jgi:hypothetical protein